MSKIARSVKSVSSEAFDTIPAGIGYQVIAADSGHPVAYRDDYASAVSEKDTLNNAAAAGGKALARALGALEDDEVLGDEAWVA